MSDLLQRADKCISAGGWGYEPEDERGLIAELIARVRELEGQLANWNCSECGWHRAVDVDAHGLVRNLLARLPFPDRLPAPEVLIEEDGYLSFDWNMGPRAVVSASLSPQGGVGFAALIGEWKTHGRFQLPGWSDTFNEALTRLGEASLAPAPPPEQEG